MSIVNDLIGAAKRLRDDLDGLEFSDPVSHVYNPLEYAWAAHEAYLRTYGTSRKRVIFVGMNPGPFGMVQTAVPFGEVEAVRSWMKITAKVEKPAKEHSARPIEGFECQRSEVSGKRLWGLFAEEYPDPDDFFDEHFVVNYCPLAFLEESGRNRTPDKLPANEMAPVLVACDRHLRTVVEVTKPEWVIGVGGYAHKRLKLLFEGTPVSIGNILHPSPASPAANKEWAPKAKAQLLEQGVWMEAAGKTAKNAQD